MGKRQSCSVVTVSLGSFAQSLILLCLAHLSAGCIPNPQQRSQLDDRITPTGEPQRAPDALNLYSVRYVQANGTEGETIPKNVAADETRKKRQLFREDIPKHRPLSGNIHAQIYGFPLPGRFNDHYGAGGQNSLHQGGVPIGPAYAPIPIIHGPSLLYEPDVADIYKHLGNGNEIVHQYPIEVSQVIHLDHDTKSGPVKVHPDQNYGPNPLKHHTKPNEPADLIVQEPVGTPLYGNGAHHHPGGLFGNAPPGFYYGTGAGHFAPPHPHGPYPLIYKIPQIFKSWPFLLHRMRSSVWPFRMRLRPKVKPHPHFI